MKEILGLVAVLLSFVAYAPYFRDIFSKRSNPHPYSWFIWGFTSVLIFALQMSHGGGAGAYTTASVAVISFTVCILAIRNGGKKDITHIDTIMLIMAIIATCLWPFANHPTPAMVLLVSSDMLGLIPTIRRSWDKPYGETLSMWGINGVRHGLSIFALAHYTLLTLLNPVAWVFGTSGFCVMLIVRRRQHKPRPAGLYGQEV